MHRCFSEILDYGGYLGLVVCSAAEVVGIVRARTYFGKFGAEGSESGLGQNPRLHGGKDGEGTDFWRLAVDEGVQTGED